MEVWRERSPCQYSRNKSNRGVVRCWLWVFIGFWGEQPALKSNATRTLLSWSCHSDIGNSLGKKHVGQVVQWFGTRMLLKVTPDFRYIKCIQLWVSVPFESFRCLTAPRLAARSCTQSQRMYTLNQSCPFHNTPSMSIRPGAWALGSRATWWCAATWVKWFAKPWPQSRQARWNSIEKGKTAASNVED